MAMGQPSDSIMAYHFGDWPLVFISILLFSLFALFSVKPLSKKDWKSLGLYEAYIVSLFTEMFGIPLTIYFLSSLFGLPLTADPAHGHLLAALLAMVGVWGLETGVTVVMAISSLMLFLALYLVIAGWQQVFRSKKTLVTDGLYGVVRHPQYLGIIIATTAFLIQWPTILTVAMWPFLTYIYYKQALKEELEMEEKFGEKYRLYKKRVPMLIPRLKHR